MSRFYKLRRNKVLSGVLAGLADKYGFDIQLLRVLYVLFTIFNFGLGIVLYIVVASLLPYKEDEEREMYGTGPRRRKNAEPVSDDSDWYW